LKRFLSLWIAALLCCASAQDARSLAMGGVVLPDRSASVHNPAYAASLRGGPTNTFPVPIGLLNLLVNEKLKIGNEVVRGDGTTVTTFDILAAIDQASYLNTFIFNLPSSPTDINLLVDRDANGEPVARLDFGGGSNISLDSVNYGNDYALPFSAAAGPMRIGLRPYTFVNGSAVPDTDFAKLFTTGTASGTVNLGVAAEAGVTLDVFYATKLPDAMLVGTDVEGANIYLGVRGAPFFGFAKADASGSATVEVNPDGETASYDVDGTAFVSAIGVSGFGYGVVADVGAAADIPVDGAIFSVGLGLRNLGFGIWSGQEYTVSGSSEDDDVVTFSDPVSATRSFVAPNFGLTLNGAYSLDGANLPPLINSVIIASDVGFGASGFGVHLGAESVFGFESVTLAARAGLGYDDGFKLGIGAGLGFGSGSLDFALASHRAPFTTHQSFGIAASIGF